MNGKSKGGIYPIGPDIGPMPESCIPPYPRGPIGFMGPGPIGPGPIGPNCPGPIGPIPNPGGNPMDIEGIFYKPEGIPFIFMAPGF